jgi:phage terminase large subunit-like protein
MAPNTGKNIDFDVFVYLWNLLQTYSTPDHHARIAMWLQECWARGDQRLLLMAFRASGKSTLIALYSAWRLCRDPDLRILVLSAESSLSERMVRNIRKIIEKHPLTRNLIPKKADQWANDCFTVRRARELKEPSVRAAGLFSNITGSRADIIICDDVEVPNTCDTVDKRRILRERLGENEFILVPGGTQIYAGTPHTWDSIYADAPKRELGQDDVFLKDYKRLSLPILNAAGKSAWPERYSITDIEYLKRQTGPNKFASQMMLTPVNITEGRLDPALLKRYDGTLDIKEVQQKTHLSILGKKLVSCSAWWDPAFGSAGGDDSVLAVIYTDEDGDYYLHRMEYITAGNGGMDEATEQCQTVCRIAKELYIPSITIETNGIGKFLPAILRREMSAARISCAVVDTVNTKPKDIRILEAFDAVMAARALYVHASVYATPFIREMQEWRPGIKGGHDDGLDAAAGALSREPVRLRRLYHHARQNWQLSGEK